METKIQLQPFLKKFATVEDVQCPLCRDYWTKLHRCDYQPEGREAVTTFVCVECAEGVKSLPAINNLDPIFGAKIYIDPIPLFKRAEELEMRSAWQAKVVFTGNEAYVIRCRATSYPIYIVKNGTIHSFQNIYQAWEFLKNPPVEEHEEKFSRVGKSLALLLSILVIR